MLSWLKQFNIFCLLDSQSLHYPSASFDFLVATGCTSSCEADDQDSLDQLKTFYRHNHDWVFGHLGYDLKDELETLSSQNEDRIGFPKLFFFIPETVIRLKGSNVEIFTIHQPETVFQEIMDVHPESSSSVQSPVSIQQKFSRDEYIQTIEKIRQHIKRGDCYELNFCQEFYAADTVIDPYTTYNRLTTLSPNPFSVFYRLRHLYCIGASPERYIAKKGKRIFSQPIKGTVKRDLTDTDADARIKEQLFHNPKERSENVMIVDLVRNDLSKVCAEGSVNVDELFGIYTFPQVHHIISTVSGTVDADTHWIDIIQASFPMGSMTGAPKKRVMELIETYEKTKRGLFSGTIGYVEPNGDFDFNVVIRSILYNEDSRYVSFQTGGAITYNSDAEQEYEESILKAGAMINVLKNQ